VAFAIALGLGTAGSAIYLHALGYPSRPTDDLYLALQCFVLSLSGATRAVGYPWPLDVARFLSPVLLAYTTLLALAALFRQKVDNWLTRFDSEHVVLCGLGEQGQALLHKLSGSPRQVVAVDVAPSLAAVDEARRANRRLLIGDAREADVLARAGVDRADSVVVACGADEVNGQVLAAIDDLVRRRARKVPISVQVQIESVQLAERLVEHEFRFGPRTGCVAVDFVCLTEMAARRVMRLHPAPAEDDGWGPVAVVGCGPLAEAVVFGLGQLAATRSLASAPVIVVDPDAEALVQRVQDRHPRLRAALELRAVPNLANGVAELPGPRRPGSSPAPQTATVYVCVPDEAEALAQSLGLQLACGRETKIVVVTRKKHSLLQATLEPGDEAARIEHIGVLDDLVDHETLLGGFHEELARAIHGRYLQIHADEASIADRSRQKWPNLASELRGQNRDQARYMVKMLKDVGARAVPVLSLEEAEFALDDACVLRLAEEEHDRWAKLKRDAGWSYGERDGRQDPARKLHPDLVPFGQLSPEARKKDIDAVEQFPLLLASLHYRLVPLEKRSARAG
jgi:hypothetical protein